jgi:hypothetical protein
MGSREPPFFIWLEAHPALVDFIKIDTLDKRMALPRGVTFEQYRDRFHERTCADLSLFQEEKLETFPSTMTAITRALRDDRRLKLEKRSLYHIVSWLEYKIFRLRSKHYRSSMQLLEDLQSILQSDFIPPNYLLVVDIDAVKTAILTEPPRLTRVKHSFRERYMILKDSQRSCPTPDQQKQRINKLIDEALKRFDPEISFFPPIPLQHHFDRLLLLPNSCCYQKLHALIGSFQTAKPSEFMNGLVDVCESLAQMFEIKDPRSFSVIVTLLIRTVFDEVYPTIEMFKRDSGCPDLLRGVRGMTVRDLRPPPEYAPEMAEDDLPGLIFRMDPHFRKVIDQLEFIAFYTNPLDVIHQLHLALKDLERAIDAHRRPGVEVALMLPFDVTFPLFLGALAGAVIPEYWRVAEFTMKYAPSRKVLSGSFNFAVTQIQATIHHLNNPLDET